MAAEILNHNPTHESSIMKFMITWQFQPGKLHDTLAKFAQMTPEQDQALMGKEIKLIGRWHDLTRGRGVCIVESNNAEAVSRYSLNWNGVVDLDASVVLDDAETRALGKSLK
jgi:hypothetical protein